MQQKRKCGVLLHPTSLPSRFGIGDIGPSARETAHLLHIAGQQIWAMLPLVPPGAGNSPYSSQLALAGNELLISLEDLVTMGLLKGIDISCIPAFAPTDRVNFAAVRSWKEPLLQRAVANFTNRPDLTYDFQQYCFHHAHLDTDGLFLALCKTYPGSTWTQWPENLRTRQRDAVLTARQTYRKEIYQHKVRQYLFAVQWQELRRTCKRHGIEIMGDVPIYVEHNSSAVWAHQELFQLDRFGNPVRVAGVPGDYFCPTGQLWGNPLYDWDRMDADGYSWWRRRMESVRELTDLVRLDHARAAEAYWAVPAAATTAQIGEWVQGPGMPFLEALIAVFKGDRSRIIAENLGYITPEVNRLLTDAGLAVMEVLQFIFDGTPYNINVHCLDKHIPESVVYTGTHDNKTVVDFYNSAPPEVQHEIRKYFSVSGGWQIEKAFIRAAYASAANTAIIPMQDVLGLGREGLMNVPGKAGGNWTWRMTPDQFTPDHAFELRELARQYNRL